MDPALVVTISTSGAGEVQVTATNTDGRPVTNVTIDIPDVPGVRVRIATATPGTAAVAVSRASRRFVWAVSVPEVAVHLAILASLSFDGVPGRT